MISMVAAIARKSLAIGYQNRLPWDLPSEKQYFHQLVQKRIVVMGYQTWRSMGGPITQASEHWVLTAQHARLLDLATVNSNQHTSLTSKVQELRYLQRSGRLRVFTDWLSFERGCLQAAQYTEVMVVGGAQVYHQMLPHAKRLYLTLIDGDYPGDRFFPDWLNGARLSDWLDAGDPEFFAVAAGGGTEWRMATSKACSERGVLYHYTVWDRR